VTPQHTCAIRLDGTVACWGGNEFGQLGIGTTDNESTPQLVSGLPYITAIAAGAQHTCALDASGQLYCWGGNSSEQLGDGGTTDAASPQPVTTLPGVAFVAADLEHTCAVTTDGIAFCWGGNSSGQLGYPTSEEQPYSPTPQQVTGLPGVTTVTTGMSHSCALNRDGTSLLLGRRL